MTFSQLAAAGLCALLLTACADGDPPTADPTSPIGAESSSPVTSTSPPVTSSPSPTSPGPLVVLRLDGVAAQDAAERVGVDPVGAVTALTWTDRIGANTVVLRDIGDERAEGEQLLLRVDHAVQVGDRTTLLRQVKDDVTDCDVDKKLAFVDEALQVRDDDGDGVGEVVFAYRANCAGDPSPSSLKVLLLENGEKHILRGSSTNELDTRGTSPVPEPAPDAWPTGSYPFLLDLYTRIQPE